MKKSILALAVSFAFAACAFTACDSDNDNNNGQQQNADQPKNVKSSKARVASNISNENLKSFVDGQYDLNFELMRASADQIANKNAMISTFSIQMALAMVWAGADDDNAAEMRQVLHFDDNTHDALNKLDDSINLKNKSAIQSEYESIDAVEIKTSNNLYFSTDKYTWSPEWLDILAVNYDAGLQEMSFASDPEAARQYINGVVSKDTHDRIKDLIPQGQITSETQSVITNAIYFKAPWKSKVHKASDKMVFHKLDNSEINVDYLSVSEHFDYMADENSNYQAVTVPLRDNDFSVMFIMPSENKFEEVQNLLNGQVISGIFDSFSHDTEVKLKFPSYSFETSLSLKSSLQELGMQKAFVGGFQKMTTEPNELIIGEVFHKTFVGMDENGVEAAAATAVIMDNATAMPSPDFIELSLDRPYFFVIYETDSKSPLFVGRVIDPSGK